MIKKLISLTLCLILCLTAFTIPAHAIRITDAQKAYASGGVDALWALAVSGFKTYRYVEEGCAELAVWTPDGPAFAEEYSPDTPMQTFYRVMMQETAGVGFTLEQVMTFIPDAFGGCFQTDCTSSVLPDGPVHIDPCGSFSYRAGCPATGDQRWEIIVAAGTDDNGHQLEFYGIAQRLNIEKKSAAEVPVNPDFDTENLRYEADFEVEVADGVWWVPVNVLGKSRYSNREIAGMVEHTPEEKQAEISTLYEALQLYQISNFCEDDDNVRIREGKINWEHHKPGYDAVRTNCGCCATCSNWLSYILRGDYEQLGFIAYSDPDGSGHVFNYLFQDGWYYFIDLTHYRTDFMEMTRPESGLMSDYTESDFVAANLHRTKDPEAYVKYCVDSYNDPPARFFLYQAEDCLPLDGVMLDGQMTIVYPDGFDIKVMDGKDPQRLDVAFMAGPKKGHKWSSLKNARFRVDEKYLAEPEAETGTETAGPLTGYQPGDTLTLEDNSEYGFAVIDGTDYTSCTMNECRFIFEQDIHLYGSARDSCFNFEMYMNELKANLEGLDSVVAGELTVDILRKIPETQIVICTREDSLLTVQEVLDGQYYDSRKIALHRNEEGEWSQPPEYWYLIIVRSGNTLYHFGRLSIRVN